MRILIIGINFHPEFIGIGKYTSEMAEFLQANNHHVRIITTPPYYPYWEVKSPYKSNRYKKEIWKEIEILRCPLWVPKKPSGMKRIIHLLSFAVSSIPGLLGNIFWKPEIVMCIAPSLFNAPFASFFAKIVRAKSWLHIQDFEIDAALGLGIVNLNRHISRFILYLESRLLKSFDRVSTISTKMVDKLLEKGVSKNHAELFPNWIDTDKIFRINKKNNTIRDLLGIPDNKIVVLYSGNMGLKQGLEIVVQAAHYFSTRNDIIFVMCGEGPARVNLEKMSSGLPNILFINLQPSEKLNDLLNAADIHVLPQQSNAADLVLPSKLLGILASEKPVIVTAATGTALEKICCEIGVVIEPDDLFGICEAIQKLSEDSKYRDALGKKGREYVTEHWSKEKVLNSINGSLLHLIRD